MNLRLKNMLKNHRLYSPAGEGGEGGGGASVTAGGEGGDASQSAAESGEGGDAAKTGGDNARKPSDEEARLLKESMKRKETIDKLNKDLGDAKAVLTQLEELGGLDAIKSLVQQRKDDETKALEAKGEWERLKERMAGEHVKETKTRDDRIAELEAEIAKRDGQVVELSIGTQFSQSQFIASELTLTPAKARVIYGEHFEVQDGQVVGYDKPRGAANRTAIVDASGNALSFEAALKSIVDADPDRDHLVRAKVRQGASSDNKQVSSASKQQASRIETPASSVDKIAAGLGKIGKLVN